MEKEFQWLNPQLSLIANTGYLKLIWKCLHPYALFLLHPGKFFPSLSWGSGWVGVGSKALLGCSCSSKPQGPTYSLNEGTHHLQRGQAGEARQEVCNGLSRFLGLTPGVQATVPQCQFYNFLQRTWEMHWTPGTVQLPDAKPLQHGPSRGIKRWDHFVFVSFVLNLCGTNWGLSG